MPAAHADLRLAIQSSLATFTQKSLREASIGLFATLG